MVEIFFSYLVEIASAFVRHPYCVILPFLLLLCYVPCPPYQTPHFSHFCDLIISILLFLSLLLLHALSLAVVPFILLLSVVTTGHVLSGGHVTCLSESELPQSRLSFLVQFINVQISWYHFLSSQRVFPNVYVLHFLCLFIGCSTFRMFAFPSYCE